MAKALKTIGVVVGVVALAATGVGLAAGGAAAAAAGSATAATAMSVAGYAGLASGVLGAISAVAFKPKFTSSGNPLNFQTNPQSGLPYGIGRTRMSGLRVYAETTNTPGWSKSDDLLFFGVMLSVGGQIEGIEKFTADGETVSFNPSTGAAVGRFGNWMAQNVWTGGAMASALALSLNGGAVPGWTSAHKLSGITHALWGLRHDRDGNLYTAGVPEPAWIGKWVRVYDPRLDSTYPGGSGPCRALDESSYVWSRNPALHALTWALGRWEAGKRTVGIGAPIANIRVADFVQAANVADANAWGCGGIVYSTDSKWDVLKQMLQAGGAIPTMTGAMIGCRVNAPRISVATIASADLHDELVVASTKPRRDRFNTVIPRYRSEENDWEITSARPIGVPDLVTLDGGLRQKEIDYPLVQSEVGQPGFDGDLQAGQLAAYDIVNSREAGPISFTTGPKYIGLKTGDCVTLHVPEEGLVEQTVIITSTSLDPATAKISFTAETETDSKHAFALGKTAVPPPAFALTPTDLTPPTPVIGDWTIAPLTGDDGLPFLRLTADLADFMLTDILIQYRKDAEWTMAGRFAFAEAFQADITGLDGLSDYRVRIAYVNGEAIGEWLELGPVTTAANGLAVLIDDIQTTVDAKRTIFVQPTAPTAAESEENDWWQQTTADRSKVIATYRRVAGSGRLAIGSSTITLGGSYIELCWTPIEDQRITSALDAATDASNLADSKAVVFTMYSATETVPTGTDIGDILVRAYLSPIQIDYWNGTSWAAAATYGATADQLSTLTAALTAAANAQATADGKIDTFYQTSAPTGASLGDLWFDTDDGNKQYRHNGTAWVAVQDAAIGSAITAAAGAQATADGKVVTFVGESAPTAEGAGDLWYKASTKTMSRWSGTAWVVVSAQNVADGATVGAPAGTNVGSTAAATVESGANAGGAAANADGSIKTDKVNTDALVAATVNRIHVGTWTPTEAAYINIDYPDAGTGAMRWRATNQYMPIVKERSDSDLVILCEYVFRSTNDIVATAQACLYASTDTSVSPVYSGYLGMGQGLLLDGSARSIATFHKLNIVSGLSAGTYYLRMRMAGTSGYVDYPTGGGSITGMLQNVMVQEVKR